MIEILRPWITNVAVLMIFIAMLEIIMPNGDMKRYVKVIAGLLIILVFIKPFMTLKSIQNNFQLNIIETTNYLDNNDIENKSEDLTKYQKMQAMDIYKSNIRKQIISHINNQYSINSENIIVELDIENDIAKNDYGNINNICITINEEDKSIIEVSKIENIAIKNKTVINKKPTEYNLNDSKLCKDIKNSIYRLLGINESNITVKVQESK